MNDNNISTPIILNITSSNDARHFATGEILHRDELKNIIEKIETLISRSKTDQTERRHDTFTILGTRGSGKTSFLLSIRQYFSNENYQNAGDVAVLPIVDPTLIEEKGHIFLVVISRLKELVDEKLDILDEIGDQRSSEGFNLSFAFQLRQAWNKILEDFAHGLPSIDGIGGNFSEADWQDPEYIMQKGLKAISSASMLEKNFSKLIDFALDILKKKTLLLFFDDIDIDYSKGWPILETIRKYFTTTKLVTVLSGDLELFSIGIRRNKWENFGDYLFKAEMDKLGKIKVYENKVTEMESQYLQKLLKPENRFYLQILSEKIFTKKETVLIKVNETSQPKNILDYYNQILHYFGIINIDQLDAYKSFLLSLPLRYQIRFLSAFDERGELLPGRNVLDPFISDLIEKGISLSALNNSPSVLNILILRLLINEGQLKESYQLQPTLTDSSLNGSLMGLTLHFSQQAKSNPALIFDYFVRIGYLKNISEALNLDQSPKKDENPSLDGLISHSRLLQDSILKDCSGLISAYLIGIHGQIASSKPGDILQLEGLRELAKKKGAELNNRIDAVFGNNTQARILGFMPLTLSKHANVQKTIPTYSIYQLFAVIGSLIRRSAIDTLSYGLLEEFQVRTYPMPGASSISVEEDKFEPDYIPTDSQFEYDGMPTVENEVKKWIQSYPSKPLAPHFLGKVSTRFFYAATSIAYAENGTGTGLGDSMHYRIVALFNAVLIEDIRENFKAFVKININNTILNESIFLNNLRSAATVRGLEDSQSDLSFSRWFLSCPLFLMYLNPNATELTKEILRFTGRDEIPKDMELYNLIKNVTVKGNQKPTARRTRRTRSTEIQVGSVEKSDESA